MVSTRTDDLPKNSPLSNPRQFELYVMAKIIQNRLRLQAIASGRIEKDPSASCLPFAARVCLRTVLM